MFTGTRLFNSGHMHQVRSYGRSFSYTTLWTPTQTFNETGCSDLDVASHIRSLADIDFVWKLYDVSGLIISVVYVVYKLIPIKSCRGGSQ